MKKDLDFIFFNWLNNQIVTALATRVIKKFPKCQCPQLSSLLPVGTTFLACVKACYPLATPRYLPVSLQPWYLAPLGRSGAHARCQVRWGPVWRPCELVRSATRFHRGRSLCPIRGLTWHVLALPHCQAACQVGFEKHTVALFRSVLSASDLWNPAPGKLIEIST